MNKKQDERLERIANDGRDEVRAALTANYERLSQGQRRVIDRLLADVRYGAVVSAAELAKELALSESTVTRAAQGLGFEGYPDLQARFRERFVGGVDERIAASSGDLGDTPEAAAVGVMREDVESLLSTIEDLDVANLRRVVDSLVEARRVYIFASRGSYGLAVMLGIGLQLLLPDTRLLNQAHGDLPDQLLHISRDDLMIGISFKRVDRVTVEVIKHANANGVKTVGIADHLSSPVARHADLALVAQIGLLRVMPSYTAAASLVNGLVAAVSVQTGKGAVSSLRIAEEVWGAFGTYEENF